MNRVIIVAVDKFVDIEIRVINKREK